MKNGGTVLFDTRDAVEAPPGAPMQGPGMVALRSILSSLDIPELEPLPRDHVLAKTFYLLRDFPGRFVDGQLWVEAQPVESEEEGNNRPVRGGDGVSSILITSNDFAGAWAMHPDGQAMLPLVPGEPRQREFAFRAGVNIVMYALTGNYKADQVHIPALLERLGSAAASGGAAVPVLAVRDTLRRGGARPARPLEERAGQGREGEARWELSAGCLDRQGLHLTQTPQVFRPALLREAYARLAGRPAGAAPLTDDAQLVEELGHAVQLVPGEPQNLKITEPADLALAEQLVAGTAGGPRAGLGYDVHRLVSGRPLVLGGVSIEHPLGLLGHSDADVLCHALGDALLGAAGLGDLGRHFPPSEELWRGARSLELLALVEERVARAGLRVANVDAMLICEAPSIAPHATRMRENLATVLRVPVARVSIKATTNESLGFLGRGEGIACLATALLLPRAPAATNEAGERLS
jgi:2-C-methyl-D-erythritol 2,4-cyclodiphosphate synthase